MLKDIDIGYIAGIIDGEGSISLNQKTNLRISVSMTDFDILQKCYNLIKIGKLYGPYDYGKGNKIIWRWQIDDNRSCASLLMTIFPLMSQRRQEKIIEVLNIWINKPLPYRSDCGSHAGYYKHRRNSEVACIECKKAAAAYNLKRYHAKKK